MVNLLQTSYLSVSTVDNLNPIEASLYSLKFMNGYNKMFENSTFFQSSIQSRRLLQQTSSDIVMNARLNSLGYMSPHLLENFNYMYVAIVGVIIVFLIVYGVGRCIKNEKVQKVGVFFLKDITFSLLFFNISNMGFSFGLQCRYLTIGQVWTTSLYVSWVFALLSLVIMVVYLIYYMKSTIEFGGFCDKFKSTPLAQWHYSLFLIARYLVNLTAGIFNEYPEVCYGLIAFEVVTLVFICFRRPYRFMFFNITAIINESILLLFLVGNMIYRNLTSPLDSGTTFGEYVVVPAWIQIALLGICLVANYTAFGFYVYRKCCGKPSRKIHDQDKLMREMQDQSSVDKLRESHSNMSFQNEKKNQSASRDDVHVDKTSYSRTQLEAVDYDYE